ncbi:MAG: cytidine kinase [Devosia sp.]|jgi:ribokinase|nr:cytidine kinase [Devosia sp.]
MDDGPDLVCLGNFTIDDVVLPDGTEMSGCTGGDALYATLAAKPWMPRTELVAPIGSDLPPDIAAAMERAGLSNTGMPARALPTLHNRVEYRDGGEREWTLYATEEAFDLLSPFPEDIPQSFLNARMFLVLAMTLSGQVRLVKHLRETTSGLIALDAQEDYIEGNIDTLLDLVGMVDFFMPSAEEVRRLLGTGNWESAARTFAARGPRVIVIKLGAEGCLVYDATIDSSFVVPSHNPHLAIDTTGAGDSFCGAFCAAYLETNGDLRAAAIAGTTAASFAVSGYGVDPLYRVSKGQMLSRYAGLLS